MPIPRCISQFSNVISLLVHRVLFMPWCNSQYPGIDWARLSSPIQRCPFSWLVLCVELGDSIWPWRSSSDSSPAGTELWLGCSCIVSYLKFTGKAIEICIMQYYLPECICPFYVKPKLFSKSIIFWDTVDFKLSIIPNIYFLVYCEMLNDM